MASNKLSEVSALVSALRAHLRNSIPYQDDRRQADEHLLGLISCFAGPDDEGGVAMGERLRNGEAPGESGIGRSGVDVWPKGSGLDAGFALDRRPWSWATTDSALARTLRGVDAPRSASAVR